jgi:Cu(I)/Ag(I) efflux system membrane fusion protein
VVTKKEIVEGSRVEMGAMPFEIVDLSQVWVLADLYETDLRFVKPGMTATLRLDAWPGRTWEGKVLFIDPMLDGKTRTAKVRLAFANGQGELKPEMYGEVTIAREGREALRVPSDAIVHTGTQSVVFVAHGEGRFEPRSIQVGEKGKDFTEVVSGLSEGDDVITRANFLIDSESRLRASLQRFGAQP